MKGVPSGPAESRKMMEYDFPIEKVRLQSMPAVLCVFVACCVGYGWSLEKKANIAVPLVLQIICDIFTFCLVYVVIDQNYSGLHDNMCHEHNANSHYRFIPEARSFHNSNCTELIFRLIFTNAYPYLTRTT